MYCNHTDCSTDVSHTCPLTGSDLAHCPNPEKQVYKTYARVPHSNARLTKTHPTRSLEEAIKQSIEFRQQVKQGLIVPRQRNASAASKAVTQPNTSAQETPESGRLLQEIAKYVGHLVDKPTDKKKLSKSHVQDIESSFKYFVKGLAQYGLDVSNMRVEQLDEAAAEYIDEQWASVHKLSPSTINRFNGYFKRFWRWYCEEQNVSRKSPFRNIHKKNTTPSPQALPENEYLRLLEVISEENGWITYANGRKVQLYRDYLVDGIRLGLLTGLRREELCRLRYDSIVEDESGYKYFIVPDFKINNIQKRILENEKKYKPVVITKELQELLQPFFEQYKNTSAYVLAPELGDRVDRTKVMPNNLSRAFGHFYSLLHTGKKLGFKSLRKSFASRAVAKMGYENARILTGHSENSNTLNLSYLDKLVLARAAQELTMLSPASREREIEIVRNKLNVERNDQQIER